MSQPLPRLNDYMAGRVTVPTTNSSRVSNTLVVEQRVSPGVATASPPTVKALTVPRVVGKMNQTEARYMKALEVERLAGRIVRYDFEPVKLRLADMTYLTPDFRVILKDGTEEYHEVKGGYVREDGWIKLKLAAELHPYVFKMCQLRKGAWTIRTV